MVDRSSDIFKDRTVQTVKTRGQQRNEGSSIAEIVSFICSPRCKQFPWCKNTISIYFDNRISILFYACCTHNVSPAEISGLLFLLGLLNRSFFQTWCRVFLFLLSMIKGDNSYRYHQSYSSLYQLSNSSTVSEYIQFHHYQSQGLNP